MDVDVAGVRDAIESGDPARLRAVLRGAALDGSYTVAAVQAVRTWIGASTARRVGELCGIGEQEAILLLGHLRGAS